MKIGEKHPKSAPAHGEEGATRKAGAGQAELHDDQLENIVGGNVGSTMPSSKGNIVPSSKGSAVSSAALKGGSMKGGG